MEAEGVIFRAGFEVGVTVSVQRLLDDYDVIVMAGGAEAGRDLEVPGRELSGVHYAMEFLTQQNQRNAGDPEKVAAPTGTLTAAGKHVVVIGGGDTGSDCIGTSNRHGAASVTQLEIMPQPPGRENKALTWPDWPLKLRTSSSQEEGCERDFAVVTKRAIGADGKITELECARVEWVAGEGRGACRCARSEGLDLQPESRPRPPGHGLHRPPPGRAGRERGRGARSAAATSRPTVSDYQDLGPQHLRPRRQLRRGQSLGGLGDPRGPPVRARRRRSPDGRLETAPLNHRPLTRPSEVGYVRVDAAGFEFGDGDGRALRCECPADQLGAGPRLVAA